jgi:hypothetical protein
MGLSQPEGHEKENLNKPVGEYLAIMLTVLLLAPEMYTFPKLS